MKMINFSETTVQRTILNRKDCTEELRDFFDSGLQTMYTPDYSLKFISQVAEPSLRKEQRLIELIKGAGMVDEQERLRILQEYGGTHQFDCRYWFSSSGS